MALWGRDSIELPDETVEIVQTMIRRVIVEQKPFYRGMALVASGETHPFFTLRIDTGTEMPTILPVF